MRFIIGGAAAIALGLACGGCGDGAVSTAQADTTQGGDSVTAIGCPATPKPGCVTMTAQGKTYDVTAAGIDLSKGVGVSLNARAPGGSTACGLKVTDVSVDYLNLQCKHAGT